MVAWSELSKDELISHILHVKHKDMFGSEHPAVSDKCKYCKTRHDAHYGTNCPTKKVS